MSMMIRRRNARAAKAVPVISYVEAEKPVEAPSETPAE